ncbi:MAG: hypothetical protein Q8O57_01785, partial [Kiritimatiellota bacterium]|nr:hypothetical protein [Kiritimatiellota bacterium]
GTLELHCGIRADHTPETGIIARQNKTEHVMFCNLLRRNQVMQPSFSPTWHLWPSYNWPWHVGEIDGAIRFGTSPVDSSKYSYHLFHWTVIENNHVSQAPIGIRVHYRCADTILSHNRFDGVDEKVRNEGARTLVTK